MSDESRIDEIVGGWRERRDRGEAVDAESLIAANPDLADTLRARFAAMDVLDATLAKPRSSRAAKLRPVEEDRYAEFRVLGQGGMGIVYWALDTDLNRQVAFKVVRPDAGQSGAPTPTAPMLLVPPGKDTPSSQAFATLKARFLQEAWVTAGLEHPGIVPVYEVGQTPEGVPYYTMRFVKGSRTLAAAIEEVRGKPIDERLALLEPFLRVCDTIRYAHAHGVIHRDLKPDNVALGEFGEVVVLDWGLARMRDAGGAGDAALLARIDSLRDAAQLQTTIAGTPGYMSPESAMGDASKIDERSDVYSLGAILYQILTGRLPHAFANFFEFCAKLATEAPPAASSLDSTIPEDLSVVCVRALERDPAARFASVDEIAASVRAWLAQRAADREVDALREQAKAAFDAASTLQGNVRLHQLDRAASACDQVIAKRGDDASATSLRREIDALRARGVEERASATRRAALRRVGVAALVFLVVAGAVVAWTIHGKQQETERERDAKEDALGRVRAERDAKTDALRRARALGLVSAAQATLDGQPLRSLLLAREAVRTDDSAATTNVLRRALVECRERALLREVLTAAFSPDGSKIVTATFHGGAEAYGPTDEKTARVWDVAGTELAVLRGHEHPVQAAAFSPDGAKIVTASYDETARVWDVAGKELAVLRGHEGPVQAAAFSPNGSKIVTASQDRTARAWDVAGKELAVLRGHDGMVHTAAFDPYGSKILTTSQDKTARVWDLSGKELAVLRGNEGGVNAAAFSPGGATIVTACDDRTARVWDLAGKEIAVLRGHRAGVGAAAFSPDGRMIVTASGDRTARVWNLAGEELAVLRGHESGVEAAAFSRDGSRIGSRIVTASQDKTARVWELKDVGDVTSKELAVLRGHEGVVRAAAFSPGGWKIVTASQDKTARVWDLAGNVVAVLPGLDKGSGNMAAYSGDGSRIVTVSGSITRVWNLVGTELAVLGGATATLAPNGSKIVTTGEFTGDKTARVRDLAGKELAVLRGHEGPVRAAAFSPDGSRIVTTSDDKTARVWNPAGKALAVLRGHEGPVWRVAFSPDGSKIVTASYDATARVWDVAGKELAVLRGHEGPVHSAAFSPDGSKIVTASYDGTARVWDVAGAELAVLRGHEGPVHSAAFSPDGSTIVTASGDGTSGDGTARVWDVAGKEIAILRGLEKWGGTAAFSPDGATIVTACDDRTARVWDLAGKELAVLRGHEGRVNTAAFAPDGSKIVTASYDGTARIWLVRTEDLLKLADSRIGRDFTDEERRSYADLLGDK